MKQLLHDLSPILILAGLWAISGYMIGLALETVGISYPPLKIILAAINVIIGMMLFQGITRDPTGSRMFFEGPEHDAEGDIRVGCLWMLPASLLVYEWSCGLWRFCCDFSFPDNICQVRLMSR